MSLEKLADLIKGLDTSGIEGQVAGARRLFQDGTDNSPGESLEGRSTRVLDG